MLVKLMWADLWKVTYCVDYDEKVLLAICCEQGEADGDLHSARTRLFSATKSLKVSLLREETSDAEATAAPSTPTAKAVKVRILK